MAKNRFLHILALFLECKKAIFFKSFPRCHYMVYNAEKNFVGSSNPMAWVVKRTKLKSKKSFFGTPYCSTYFVLKQFQIFRWVWGVCRRLWRTFTSMETSELCWNHCCRSCHLWGECRSQWQAITRYRFSSLSIWFMSFFSDLLPPETNPWLWSGRCG